jgi:DNA-directed RNA polymerase specialized sigma subunit
VTSGEPAASGKEHIQDLARRLGRSPRPSEVSAQMDVELDEVIEAIAEHREPSRDQDPPGVEPDQQHP